MQVCVQQMANWDGLCSFVIGETLLTPPRSGFHRLFFPLPMAEFLTINISVSVFSVKHVHMTIVQLTIGILNAMEVLLDGHVCNVTLLTNAAF